MRVFKNLATGDIWTEDDLIKIYNSDRLLTERFKTFDNFLEFVLELGNDSLDGLKEIESPFDF